MRDRGPDDQSYQLVPVSDGALFLGHTRLSIIDLSSGGRQPMTSRDGRFTITFNGEIYNYLELKRTLGDLGHVFVSKSDTEVLLHAWCQWGPDCFRRLVGMFAFAILDRRKNELICVRDAFGIKPFFYTQSHKHFLFASEQRALSILRDDKPAPDWQRCYDYLVHGDFDSNDHTFISGINHLRPAHWLVFNIESGECGAPKCWWAPALEETSKLTFNQAAEAIRAQFLENVRLHMRSDVPVGAALSGGVDSSALVCAMRHLEPSREIKTFSYIARGYALSEEPWIDQVNRHVKAIPHKLELSGSDLATDLDDLIRVQGEPFGTPAVFGQYRIFKLAKEAGITVTLDGQGADELFAGYIGYPGYRVLSLLETGHPIRGARFACQWGRWPGRSWFQPWQQLSATLVSRAREYLPEGSTRLQAPQWINSGFLRDIGVRNAHPHRSSLQSPKGRRVTGAQCAALTRLGIPHLLRHADRASMRFSVESRVPFLTLSMADLALSLPEHFLISDTGETKCVLREAMRGIMPATISARRDKIGFGTPNKDWLLEIAPLARKWLQDSKRIPLFSHENLLERFDGIVSGEIPFTWQPWCWIIFVKWYQQVGFDR